MRKLKTDVVLIGCGGAALFAFKRFQDLGFSVTLVNPLNDFGSTDLRVLNPLCLWDAVYREGSMSLTDCYEQFEARLHEVFPAALENLELQRPEVWSVLSTTLIHREQTTSFEKEFFKLEKKNFAAGFIRDASTEVLETRMAHYGLNLSSVAHLNGAIVRMGGLEWNPIRTHATLRHFLQSKFLNNDYAEVEGREYYQFRRAKIENQYGRQIVFSMGKQSYSVEGEKGVYVFLSGDLLPHIKSMVASKKSESGAWLAGVRKRRKEQHHLYFDRRVVASDSALSEQPIWIELGGTLYKISQEALLASWVVTKGPDAFEFVLDESFRMQSRKTDMRFTNSFRGFYLQWEWKNAQWKKTDFDTYWATGFEGNLFSLMELLWTIPK
ncbi:MAG: hypothetical protein AB7F43_00935 [Bacteriovoracia bacterium]